MKKQEMIETLRLREGNAWEKLKDHEEYCTSKYGGESAYKDWTQTQREIYDRYIIIWVALSETLKDLKIQPYSYSERLELKKLNSL